MKSGEGCTLPPAGPALGPYRAWSNFEFVADDGSVNEVDALVIGRPGLFLVEIKSHPGVITGDQQRWTWTRPNDGGHSTFDNPLLAANRKARKLRSLLQRQPAYVSAKVPTPWVEPLVFLSSASLDCLPAGLALRIADGRLADPPSVHACLAEPRRGWNGG